MKMPSTTPMLSGIKKAPSAAAVTREETPLELQALMDFIRDEAKKFTETNWNVIVDVIAKRINKEKSYTGNEYLSMMGTFITHVAASWIIYMKKIIADSDEAGVGMDDLLDPICDGIKRVAESVK